MPYLSFVGEPKLFSLTRTECEFFSHVRARAFSLMDTSSTSQAWSPKEDAFLSRCQISTVYTSWWFEVLSWSWTHILNNVVGCPTLGSTFVWSSRSSFPQWLMVLGTSHFVYHLKLSPVLSAFWPVLLVSRISATRKMCVVMFPSSLLLL